MELEPLKTNFTKHRLVYEQVERHGDLAIYKQTHKDGPMVRYEVVRIRVRPERVLPGGELAPAGEAYPPPAMWGKGGFTCYTLDEAQETGQGMAT